MRYSVKQKRELFPKTYKNCACNVTATCEQLGISRNTFYQSIGKDAKLKELIDETEESVVDMAETALYSLVKEKNFPAVKFMLETKGKHRGYARNLEVTGNNGGPIEVSGDFLKGIEDAYAEDDEEEES